MQCVAVSSERYYALITNRGGFVNVDGGISVRFTVTSVSCCLCYCLQSAVFCGVLVVGGVVCKLGCVCMQ